MKLGERIHILRLENNMTMQELADKSGLSKGYISMIEKGKNPSTNKRLAPKLETVQQISTALGMELEDLLNGVNDEIELPEVDNIYSIYNSLDQHRKNRVLTFAKNELNDQNQNSESSNYLLAAHIDDRVTEEQLKEINAFIDKVKKENN